MVVFRRDTASKLNLERILRPFAHQNINNGVMLEMRVQCKV